MRVVDKSIHDCHESTRLRLEDMVTVVGIRKLAAWEGEKTGENKKIGEEKTDIGMVQVEIVCQLSREK